MTQKEAQQRNRYIFQLTNAFNTISNVNYYPEDIKNDLPVDFLNKCKILTEIFRHSKTYRKQQYCKHPSKGIIVTSEGTIICLRCSKVLNTKELK